jgi:hypothetical protein
MYNSDESMQQHDKFQQHTAAQLAVDLLPSSSHALWHATLSSAYCGCVLHRNSHPQAFNAGMHASVSCCGCCAKDQLPAVDNLGHKRLMHCSLPHYIMHKKEPLTACVAAAQHTVAAAVDTSAQW